MICRIGLLAGSALASEAVLIDMLTVSRMPRG